MHNSMYNSYTGGEEKTTALQDEALERSFPVPLVPESAVSTICMTALAQYCIREINNYRRGAPYDDQYCVEMLYRATAQRDQYAWEWFQQYFSQVVRGWLRRHPRIEIASRFDSEENYVAQTFERFWKATVHNQTLQFKTLAAALKYLQASLNGVILDTLRRYSRPKEAPLPESGDPGEPQVEDQVDCGEFWGLIQTMLPNVRERRLAYLLFHCGLKPRQILLYCPDEFSCVQEIYRLRRNILERLLRNADYIRWQLSTI